MAGGRWRWRWCSCWEMAMMMDKEESMQTTLALWAALHPSGFPYPPGIVDVQFSLWKRLKYWNGPDVAVIAFCSKCTLIYAQAEKLTAWLAVGDFAAQRLRTRVDVY